MKSAAEFSMMVLLACCVGHNAVAADPPAAQHHDMAAMQTMPVADNIPGTSLYQLDLTFETAERTAIKLQDLRGAPLIVTMFYSSCTSVCPLITAQLQQLVAALPPAAQQQIRVLMVSFDSARDTPEALTAFKAEHHINQKNWLIARGSATDVRTLAAALGIQYRELPDHSFNHSALVTLLDSDGVPRARSQNISSVDPNLLASLTALMH
jgi:protein SCO1